MLKRAELQALGKRIQELRKKRNRTQAQLAEHAGLTTNYIGKIERGEARPTLDSLLSIAKALQVGPSDLFSYLDPPPRKGEIKRRIRELLEQL